MAVLPLAWKPKRFLRNGDDTENAYRAAAGRARSFTAVDYQSFRRRIGEYLKRRGFGYEVINSTIMRLWQEREGNRIVE
jgi:SOS response regulatory protein OraA/RecX